MDKMQTEFRRSGMHRPSLILIQKIFRPPCLLRPSFIRDLKVKRLRKVKGCENDEFLPTLTVLKKGLKTLFNSGYWTATILEWVLLAT